MLANTTLKRMMVLGTILSVLMLIGGCGSGIPVTGETQTGDNNTSVKPTTPQTSTTDNTTQAQTTTLTVTAPFKDVTCAVGQPVLVTWEIQGLPASPTVDILYQASNESAAKTLLAGLSTSNIGSCQIDTFAMVPGLTYTISMQLKSSGTVSATASASGRIIIANAELTVTTPTIDVNLLPSQVLQIGWSGKYLPAGATIEAFFDFDTPYNSGNEVIVQSGTISTTGATVTGSLVAQGSNLWNNAKLQRGVAYYIGLRIVKNGQTYLGAYASATVKLYAGQGFEILYPTSDINVRYGENLQIRWSANGVPTSLKVHTVFKDRTDGTETALPSDVLVTAGSVNLLTYILSAGHSYDIFLNLLDGQTTVATRKATGVITITTTGSSVLVTNAELQQTGGKVYLGKGNTYTITWATVQPPDNATVRLFLDNTTNQLEITPAGGVLYSLNQFAYTPTDANFTLPADKDYYVLAYLEAKGVRLAQSLTKGKIRIGEGGIVFTNPAVDTPVNVGQTVTVAWDFTGDILNKFTSPLKKKILHLYASASGVYDNTSATIPLTDNDVGVDVTNNVVPVTSTTFNSSLLTGGSSYYIIGRLIVEGFTEEETRVTSTGRIVVQQSQIQVLTPATDTTTATDLTNINVTWTISGLDLTNRKMRIRAVQTTGGLDVILVDNLVAATPGAQAVDASSLPPGTYIVRCVVYEFNAQGGEVIRVTGDAPGHIIIPTGYNGTYDLAAMSAVLTTGYSPIDGTVFEGANKNDGLGYQLSCMGDLDDDGKGEFIIFAQNGNAFSAGKAGAGYLLYGTTSFLPVENINKVPYQLDSTLLAFPQENRYSTAALPDNFTTGSYRAFGLPDMSDDEKGDLIVTCANEPLTITIQNNDPANAATVQDIFGRTWTVYPGATTPSILAHVLPSSLQFVAYTGTTPIGVLTPSYGHDADTYRPGDWLEIIIDNATPNVNDFTWSLTSHHDYNLYNSMYVITSDELQMFRGWPYFLDFVGDSSVDNITSLSTTQMVSWSVANETFGFHIAPLGNYDPNGTGSSSEIVMVAEGTTVTELADPANPTRTNAGAGLILKNGSKLGLIDYTYGQGMDWISTLGSIVNTAFANPRLDVIGDTGTKLSNVIGLGKYSNSSPNSRQNFFGQNFGFSQANYPSLVALCKAENTNNGAVYVFYPDRVLDFLNIPQLDLKYFNQDPLDNSSGRSTASLKGIKINGVAGQTLEEIYAIGDFDGDNLGDFVIAMPSYNSNKGRIMIVLGKSQLSDNVSFNISDLTSLESPATRPNALIFDGEAASDKFGNNVAVIGDINGDGADDILVSAPGAGITGRAGCGKVYLIYGRSHNPTTPAFWIIKLNQSNQTTIADYDLNNAADGVWTADKIGSTLPGAVFIGEYAGDAIQTVSPAGDVNGDGVTDFLIGAPSATARTLPNAGKAYLILGRTYTLP